MIKRLTTFVYGFFAFNLLWYLLALLIQTPALVSPLSVYQFMGVTLQSGLSIHIATSLIRILEGLFIALLMGIPFGLLMAGYPRFNSLSSPLLYFTYPVPKLALLPVVMLLLGIGESAKITMIVLILIFQIIVATRDAALHIPREDFHVLISLGANKRQILRWITLPAILPEILTALRVAIGTAISVLFFTETYGTDKGMGFYIVDAWMRLSYTEMYTGILMLSLIGFILFFLIDLVEEYTCKWKKNN